MFNIDWSYIIKVLVPPFLRQVTHMDWLQALMKPLTTAWASFKTYREATLYTTGITFQTIAMEKLLNDKYDNQYRRIEIVDGDEELRVYWANKVLGWPKTWLANKWKPTEPNVVDDIRRDGEKLYKCIQAGTGQQPSSSPAYWNEDMDALFIANKSYYGSQLDFIVRVPNLIIGLINQNEMKALIEDYKFAGKRYEIQAY